jgi:hypothetical protein
VDLHIHSPLRLHGVAYNYFSARKTLRFLPYRITGWKIPDFQRCEGSYCDLPAYDDILLYGMRMPTFRRSILPPSSGQHVSPEH